MTTQGILTQWGQLVIHAASGRLRKYRRVNDLGKPLSTANWPQESFFSSLGSIGSLPTI